MLSKKGKPKFIKKTIYAVKQCVEREDPWYFGESYADVEQQHRDREEQGVIRSIAKVGEVWVRVTNQGEGS